MIKDKDEDESNIDEFWVIMVKINDDGGKFCCSDLAGWCQSGYSKDLQKGIVLFSTLLL
jgi:hypothetical protein